MLGSNEVKEGEIMKVHIASWKNHFLSLLNPSLYRPLSQKVIPGVLNRSISFFIILILPFAQISLAGDLPYYLADRGEGIPTSLFGTYIKKGELLVYTFYEYTYNSNEEYKPSELGFTGDQDHLGTTKEHEALLFLSYAPTDRLAFELEGALYTKKTLDKAGSDNSNLPNQLEESGLGDVEAQARWRWFKETEDRPEFFNFFEVAFPFQDDKVLIGTSDWELVYGAGFIKGFRWGTLTVRASLLYENDESDMQFGEYAVEYIKRVYPNIRVVTAVEGEEDEVSFIGEVQWFIRENILLKLNSGFGLTQKAPNFAPEVGIMFSF